MPIRRTIKNVVKNYTDAQVKVREATSNDPWGPSSTMMSEIADLTYNVVAFTEIMQMVWKRLNDHGKNWRHVYKTLVLLDYIIKTGSEKVAQQCRENIFAVETLKNFQYIEDGKDHGMNVREKAKQLCQLLKDDERLKNERAKALKAKERFAQNTTGFGGRPDGSRIEATSPTNEPGYSDLQDANLESPVNVELEAARPSTAGEEELQLQLALAMSKEEHDEDEKRKKQDDIKLAMALEESKKEDDVVAPGGTLLDLSQGLAGTSAASADPWASNDVPVAADPWSSADPPSSRPSADAWGAPVPAAPSTDIWSSNQAETNASNAQPDPWGSSGAAAKPVGLDDEFDIIGTRSKSPQNTTENGDSLGGGNNRWDMSGLGEAMAPMTAADLLSNAPEGNGMVPKSKSPAQFLGTHANLVNLDNLVTKPAAASTTNPFAMTNPSQADAAPVANPFAAKQAVIAGVPMNQMSSSTSSPLGFSSITGSSSVQNRSSPAFGPSPVMMQQQQPGMMPPPAAMGPGFGAAAPVGGFGQMPPPPTGPLYPPPQQPGVMMQPAPGQMPQSNNPFL